MRFNITAAAVLAMVASAFAQTADFDPITKPAAQENIAAGSTYELQWQAPAKYADGTISISLIGGKTQGTQVPLNTIATGIKNSDNKYMWKVDSALGDDAVYGLVFKLESNPGVFQYSNPFHIQKSSGAATSSTVVITKSMGVKTITLMTTSTPQPTTTSSSSSTSHHHHHNTTSTAYNTTICASTQSTTMVITSTGGLPSVTTTGSHPEPTNGVGALRAGSMAIAAGLLVALFSM